MTDVEAFEAENRLGQLLDRVEQGETIVITRRGEPVVRLAPMVESPDRAAARAAVARLLDRRKDATIGDLSIRDLIDEGRR
jgi:prevent-host-death family protein